MKMPEKLRGTHIHMVGIKGTGMAALTEILVARGAVITGSDVSERFYTDEILEKLDICAKPFSEKNIADDVALVIFSSAYSVEKNPDLMAAAKKNIPMMLYTEALGAISEKSFGCAISGVHGKTSTTGLAGTVLAQLDLPAQVLAGSVITSFGNSCTLTVDGSAGVEASAGGNQSASASASASAEASASAGAVFDATTASNVKNIFVAETCEYQRHFLSFAPEIIIITSVESDHQDYYPTYESMRDAFVEFAEKLPPKGKLIYCADDSGACEVAEIVRKKRSDIELLGYGEKAVGAYKLVFGKISDGEQHFEVTLPSVEASASESHSTNADVSANSKRTLPRSEQNAYSENFSLRVPGKHEVLDAVAAVALCSELFMLHKKNPLDYAEKIRAGLKNFAGGKRRSEIIGSGNINGNSVIVIDDYGHHPTAIKTTLAGYRAFYPERKIIVDFMSHTYTRTAALIDEFASSFVDADEIILHKIYGSAREDASKANVTGKTLFEKVSALHSDVFYFEEPLDCVEFAMTELAKKPDEKFSDGYLFVTMGAGDNWKVGKEISSKLRSKI